MILSYIIKVTCISGLLFGYYHCFLRNKRYHQYNRWFMLGSVLLSVVLPVLHIPINDFGSLGRQTPATQLLRVSAGAWEEPVTIVPGGRMFSRYLEWPNLLWLLYSFGVVLFLVALVRSLLYLRRISRAYPYERMEDIKLYQTTEPAAPFSFFRKIFWNRDLDLLSAGGKQIFRHEWFHVRQRHSFDILFLELLGVIYWFNPFLYLFKRELKAIHEFLADAYAASEENHYAYAELLVETSLRQRHAIVNPFFHNQIKRRITMITQLQRRRNNYLGRIMILPLLFILFCAFATRIHHEQPPVPTGKNITVVIDAGHGGMDAGAIAPNGAREKDITLSIAKKIQRLAPTYHVNVVLTRDRDELPGNSDNIEAGLKYRTNLVAQTKADLFLSIHVMADPSSPAANGFDIYIPGSQSPVHEKSIRFGSVLSTAIRKDYQVAPDLKQRDQPGIWILRAATVPSVLVECGYISNEKDLAYISADQNQEQIAKDMLEGIVQFSRNSMVFVNENGPAPSVDTGGGNRLDMINPRDIKSMSVLKDKGTVTIQLVSGDSVVLKNVKFYNNDSASAGPSHLTIAAMEAQFPGGFKAWSDYLFKNLKYPDAAVQKK
ncbi:MAG TPA: M56/M15 family metallopeptidase, partial [Puia sp.]|nr:M56/M15 family metallopeptidase [Puia sp.]